MDEIKNLLKKAESLPEPKKDISGKDYLPIIECLRNKGFRWGEIYKFFKDNKVQIPSTTLRKVYRVLVEQVSQ